MHNLVFSRCGFQNPPSRACGPRSVSTYPVCCFPKDSFLLKEGYEYLKTFFQPVQSHHTAALSSNSLSRKFARLSLSASQSLVQSATRGPRHRDAPEKLATPLCPEAEWHTPSPDSGPQAPFVGYLGSQT